MSEHVYEPDIMGHCLCDKCLAKEHASDPITIPRDLHDLYKEAAERWAKSCRVYFENTTTPVCAVCPAKIMGEMSLRLWDGPHGADCKAARILDLKREGAGL